MTKIGSPLMDIDTTTVSMVTKLGRLVAYHEELPPIKFQDSLAIRNHVTN